MAANGFDAVLSYTLETGSVAGRLVRLGPELESIIAKHEMPASVGLLLSEMLASAVMMSAVLKFDGILTFQSKSNGPVSQVMLDVTTQGHMRATCILDRERLDMLGKKPSAKALMGKGYLAVTVDQGPDMDRYQGIVELTGMRFVETIDHYFTQSNQQDIKIHLASEVKDGSYRAAALSAERVAHLGGAELTEDDAMENWSRAQILMGTLTDEEILDQDLPAQDLIYRLFHEEGIRVAEPSAIIAQCRCSEQRLERALMSLTVEERRDCRDENGIISSQCEFCRETYKFQLNDTDELVKLH